VSEKVKETKFTYTCVPFWAVLMNCFKSRDGDYVINGVLQTDFMQMLVFITFYFQLVMIKRWFCNQMLFKKRFHRILNTLIELFAFRSHFTFESVKLILCVIYSKNVSTTLGTFSLAIDFYTHIYIYTHTHTQKPWGRLKQA